MFYLSFLDLTTCRGQGYGTEGPISWLSIAEYAQYRQIEGEQFEDLVYHIQRLDAAYLAFKGKKLEQANKPRPGKK